MCFRREGEHSSSRRGGSGHQICIYQETCIRRLGKMSTGVQPGHSIAPRDSKRWREDARPVVALCTGQKGTGSFPKRAGPTPQWPLLQSSIQAFVRWGGTHIDTAVNYLNHRDVAQALASHEKECGLHREHFWISSKLLPQSEADAVETIWAALEELNTSYIDLMLIHLPFDGVSGLPNQAVQRKATWPSWRALVSAREKGWVRNLGVATD